MTTPFATFTLLVLASIGTCFIVKSPLRKFYRQYGGMRPDEVRPLLNMQYKKQVVLFAALLFIQTYLIEPLAILIALSSHTGSPVIACIALAIVLLNVLLLIIAVARGQENFTYPKLTKGYWAQTVVFALPTVYLWYLFFVSVGLLIAH